MVDIIISSLLHRNFVLDIGFSLDSIYKDSEHNEPDKKIVIC